jgi:hypothetical protein
MSWSLDQVCTCPSANATKSQQKYEALKAYNPKHLSQKDDDVDDARDEDLFASTTKSAMTTPSSHNQAASSRAKLSLSDHTDTIFENQLSFLADRLGSNSTNKALQPHSSAS